MLADADQTEDDFTPPKYSDVGRILVRVQEPTGNVYKWDYEVLDHDGSTFWINEGMGFDYWLDGHCEFPSPGSYLISGIEGCYVRGDRSWGEDDDEEWEYSAIEIADPSIECLE